MDKNNKSAGWAIFAVTAAAALAATGFWAYKNKDKIKNLEKRVNKFKNEVEVWKQEKRDAFSDWQEDLEDFAENLSTKYKNNPEEAKAYLGKTFQSKIKSAKKVITNIKEGAAKAANKVEQSSTAKARKDTAGSKKESEDINFGLNSRQEEIYTLIKSSAKATMQEFADKIAGVTTRTLRRDLTKLQKLGLVEQIGKTKDSYYLIKK